MHAISYIVDGSAVNNKLPQSSEIYGKSQKNGNENPSVSTNATTMKSSSSTKSTSSLTREKGSYSIPTWSIFLNKLRKMFAYQYFEKPPANPHSYRITPRVMLHSCTTKNEHYDYIEEILTEARGKYSLHGLQACGFTYKFIPCENHANESTLCPHETSRSHCSCDNRLVHIDTNEVITKKNLKRFVADGEMYEEIVRLCQEYAQECMREEGSLHWVSVCEDVQKGNPIRILVDREYPVHGNDCDDLLNHSIHDNIQERVQNEQHQHKDKTCTSIRSGNNEEVETLLITTGKGKVRAGIFSRQHLLISGVESSTALPIIRDAKRRKMRVAILDPNARGDRSGMSTYEQSMRVLFGSTNANEGVNENSNGNDNTDYQSRIGTGPVCILAHSASGSQLTRYLQTEGQHMLPRIKSIAFTDSNHSIQWLKNHSQIASFFQSPSTLYIRSSNVDRDHDWERHQCGDQCETSEHWKHRFGTTCTIWAGTTDHSLTNFTSQEQIWEHFDKCLDNEGTPSLKNDTEEEFSEPEAGTDSSDCDGD